MKAIRIHKYGGPDVLQYEDAPRPRPQAHEVLIRVHAAGVNPIDWKVREGDTKDFWPHKFPLILGWDLSGVVEDLGEGVSQFKLGDEVYCVPDPTRDGAYAEYVAIRESEIGLKPKSLYHIRAAPVPLAALTAWQALFETAQLQPGQRVLIYAGSGGVGHYAVQLAKWKGAYVFATASSKNQDFLRELGVDESIDYTQQRFELVAQDTDVVLDTLGGETQERSWSVLKPGGVLVSLVQLPSQDKAKELGVRAVQIAARPNGAQLAEIAGIYRRRAARTCDRSHPAAFGSVPRARAQSIWSHRRQNCPAGQQRKWNIRTENGNIMSHADKTILVSGATGRQGGALLVGIVVVTRAALFIARRASTWTVDEHLGGRSPDCAAVDPRDPMRVYCVTAGAGLFRSHDSGRTWEPVGSGIEHGIITALAVSHAERAEGFGIVYAGTEPSAVFRSETGGDDWVDLADLRALPSADTWSFPPRPHTHHVRWIEADVNVSDHVFVAIEAGALVRTFDGGRTWRDRVRGGPYDTHTAVTHPLAPGRIYSAAGDGYFESTDAGSSWRSPEDGLKHRYLVGVAVDPADPDTLIVSATNGPESAYWPRSASAYVYRKTGLKRWEQAMSGLPEAKGTTVSQFATNPGEPGVIYAANNRGLFRSDDAGRSWKALDLPWPEPGLADGVEALACLPE